MKNTSNSVIFGVIVAFNERAGIGQVNVVNGSPSPLIYTIRDNTGPRFMCATKDGPSFRDKSDMVRPRAHDSVILKTNTDNKGVRHVVDWCFYRDWVEAEKESVKLQRDLRNLWKMSSPKFMAALRRVCGADGARPLGTVIRSNACTA
jgi:hypothetical protein